VDRVEDYYHTLEEESHLHRFDSLLLLDFDVYYFCSLEL